MKKVTLNVYKHGETPNKEQDKIIFDRCTVDLELTDKRPDVGDIILETI